VHDWLIVLELSLADRLSEGGSYKRKGHVYAGALRHPKRAA
jgi:hypothetical protein